MCHRTDNVTLRRIADTLMNMCVSSCGFLDTFEHIEYSTPSQLLHTIFVLKSIWVAACSSTQVCRHVESVPQFVRPEVELGGCTFTIISSTNGSSSFCSPKAIWVVTDLPESLPQFTESSSDLLPLKEIQVVAQTIWA